MHNVKVTVDLPFFLQLRKSLTMTYEKLCRELPLPELTGKEVRITFVRRNTAVIHKNPELRDAQSTIIIKITAQEELSDEVVGTFAIHNCREIINNIIYSYQTVTQQVVNAGYITPIGTSYMQLYAEISVDGRDFRDRYPFHAINTFPLTSDQTNEFKRFLRDNSKLPLSRLFLTMALVSLEQGQYSIAILQAAMAVELGLTQVVHKRLKKRRWPDEAIEPYENLTLGQKLRLKKNDPRSLKYYFRGTEGFSSMYKNLNEKLIPLRNKVVHEGYLATRDEALHAIQIVREFFKVIV